MIDPGFIDVLRCGQFVSPPDAPAALRAFPFPFAAALTLVNDSIGCTASSFVEWHNVATENGLEVSDSLRFDDRGELLGDGKLVELARAGFIDGLSSTGSLTIPEALGKLDDLGISVRCFFTDDAIQNLEGLQGGFVDYVSDRAWMMNDNPGDHLKYVAFLRSALHADWLSERFPNEKESVIAPSIVLSRPARDEAQQVAASIFNRTLVQATDLPFTIFKRLAGYESPSLNTLPLQCRSLFLDKLQRLSGVVAIAQRFAIQSSIGRSGRYAREQAAGSPMFDHHELLCWTDLGQRAAEGNLLVAQPSRLFDWLLLRERLIVKCEKHVEHLAITVSGVAEGGGIRLLDKRELPGLSFLVPPDVQDVQVRVAGHVTLPPFHRSADPVNPGRDCCYFKWEPRIWPVLSL